MLCFFDSGQDFEQIFDYGFQDLRDVRGVKGGFDDVSIDGEDGQYYVGQEYQGQFIDVFDVYEDYYGYEDQRVRFVYTYVVQYGRRFVVYRISLDDGRIRGDVSLWG